MDDVDVTATRSRLTTREYQLLREGDHLDTDTWQAITDLIDALSCAVETEGPRPGPARWADLTSKLDELRALL